MASGGAKNIGLAVVAVAAIGGAVYLLSQSMGGGGTVNTNEKVYFVVNGTETSDNPTGTTMTLADYNSHMRNRKPIIIDGSDDVSRAGLCPNGHYYPLGGHLEQPESCPAAGCGIDLGPYDLHGNRSGG